MTDRSYKPASRPSCKSMAEKSRLGAGRGGDSEARLRRVARSSLRTDSPTQSLQSFEFRRCWRASAEPNESPSFLPSRARPIKATPPPPSSRMAAAAAAASFLPSRRQSDLFVISGIGACEEGEGGRVSVCCGSNETKDCSLVLASHTVFGFL